MTGFFVADFLTSFFVADFLTSFAAFLTGCVAAFLPGFATLWRDVAATISATQLF